MKHGGKRKGAGRPQGEPGRRVTIRLSQDEKTELDAARGKTTFKELLFKGLESLKTNNQGNIKTMFKCEKCETKYKDQSDLFNLEVFDNGECTMICHECTWGDQTSLAKFLDDYGIKKDQDWKAEETAYILPGYKIVLSGSDTEIVQ